MTVGFGHGIAVSPLHVVRGTAALANGGIAACGPTDRWRVRTRRPRRRRACGSCSNRPPTSSAS